MKTMIKLSFVLGVYGMVACVGLALVYTVTAPTIAAASNRKVNDALKVIFPEAESFPEVTEAVTSGNSSIVFEKAYVALGADDAPVGMAIQVTGPTYKSTTVLAGINADRTIRAVQFMANSDTPGLGTKTAESPFADQFPGKSVDDEFAVGSDIAAISGATISSKGVARILKITGFAAGKYLAANYGTDAGTGAAPDLSEPAPMNLETALVDIFPGAEFRDITGSLVNELEKSVVFDSAWLVLKDGKTAGVAVQARGQTYYASTLLVGVGLDRTLSGVRVNETKDSKNYGFQMCDPAFYGEFTGKSVDDAFLVKQATPEGDIDSISGATVSSMGFANIVKVAALEGARYLVSEGGRKASASAGPLVLNAIPEQE